MCQETATQVKKYQYRSYASCTQHVALLMLVNICMKFHKDTVLNLQSGHNFVVETATYKVQRGIRPEKKMPVFQVTLGKKMGSASRKNFFLKYNYL